MSERWVDAIDDLDLLQTLLAADPKLTLNMLEMGFIKSTPFQLDHNGETVSKWVLTKQGREEILGRYIIRSNRFAN